MVKTRTGPGWTLIQADAVQGLRSLPIQAAHCVVTSPPYWGLRDYKCDGQIGLEDTVDEYVNHLVAVFAEVWRVLKDDGTLWLNLGDSYNAYNANRGTETTYTGNGKLKNPKVPSGHGLTCKTLKNKDLIGVPWRVAFALQSFGWLLRADIIWNKPNPMPESVRDRPTKSHEYLFMFAKVPRYYYDKDAIKEPVKSGPADIRKMREGKARIGGRTLTAHDPRYKANAKSNIGKKRGVGDPSGRNKRSVWEVATVPYRGAHFATYPPKLVEPCILAGTRAGGIVLDPFAGTSTTGQVALNHGRSYIGIELDPRSMKLSEQRLKGVKV